MGMHLGPPSSCMSSFPPTAVTKEGCHRDQSGRPCWGDASLSLPVVWVGCSAPE